MHKCVLGQCVALISERCVMLLQRTLCVLAANACLGVLTAFHLAYLGLMFDSSSDQDQVCPPLFTCALQSIMLLPWVF